VTSDGSADVPRNLLALETSSPVGSVAVARGRSILARRFLPVPGGHAARIVPAVRDALEEAGVDRTELDGIVVGRGPGSFTGVRIAAATARGLALGLGIPLWPWSSLAGAAASLRVELPLSLFPDLGPAPELPDESEGWPLVVLLDARDRRVYAGCFRLLPGRMDTLFPPRATTVDGILEEDLPPNALFCGDGALRHAGTLERAGYVVLPPPTGVPTAEGVLRVHGLNQGEPPVPPGSRWEPEYLRGSSARRPGAGAASRKGGESR
jgi:tRNA threonylcarbamoyladenosine biosynthesis protein TsaB